MPTSSSRNQAFWRYFPLSERDRKWGLFVTTTGQTRIAPGQPYPPAGHPKGYAFDWSQGRILNDHHFVYISGGRGWFESRQTRRQLVEAGSVILLFPGVWHRYMPDPETGWEEHWIGFDGPIPRRWVRNNFFSPRDPLLKPAQEEQLLNLYLHVVEAIRANQPALQQVMAGAVNQMAGFLYSALQARLTGQSPSVSAIQTAIERMQRDPAARLDLPALATQLGVSYSWLRRTFTRHTGLSPHQYLLELRLVRGRDLLARTSLSVKEISRQVGFDDEHYFCRLFRRKNALTPTEWRAHSQRRVSLAADHLAPLRRPTPALEIASE